MAALPSSGFSHSFSQSFRIHFQRYRPVIQADPATASGHPPGMDDTDRLLLAWLAASHVDPDAAEMITDQLLAGRISPEQAIGALLELAF